MVKLLLFFFLKLAISGYITDNVIYPTSGLANQIIYFQHALQHIVDHYPNETWLIHGPESDLIKNSYNNHSFYEFFSKRNLDGCLKFIWPEKRTFVCEKYMGIVCNSTDKFDISQLKRAKVIRPAPKFCMPWNYKSTKGGKFHCPRGHVENLPFFLSFLTFRAL